MKKVFLFCFLVLISFINYSQVKVDIIVNARNVQTSEKIFISGNQENFGFWNPGLIELNKLNDTLWSKTFNFNQETQIEFKFTKGDWSNEALDSTLKVPTNYKLIVKNDTTLYFKIVNWNTEQNFVSGKITGSVKYHFGFNSKYVLPRDIIVWLPPSYDSLNSKRYPVLYMHDGQNIIDPKTSAFGVDWGMDETADSLISENLIDEIIIVGINNTYLRSEEYSNSEIGYNYLKFIVNELKPFIDNTYSTLPDKKNTATAGSSMGGLISFMAAWEYPEIFSKAACLSPAFKINQFDYVKIVKQYSGEFKYLKIYIDNGGLDLEQDLQPGIDEMLVELKLIGFREGENLLWIKDEVAEHNELAWSKRVPIFLKYFFPKLN